MEPVIVGAVGKVKIQPFLRDFQAEGESPAVGLFYGAAFSTALLPINSAKEPKYLRWPREFRLNDRPHQRGVELSENPVGRCMPLNVHTSRRYFKAVGE